MLVLRQWQIDPRWLVARLRRLRGRSRNTVGSSRAWLPRSRTASPSLGRTIVEARVGWKRERRIGLAVCLLLVAAACSSDRSVESALTPQGSTTSSGGERFG